MPPYAEVIGDPVSHSKSPAIHGFWLGACGIEAEYRATRVQPHELRDYLAARRQDPDWRGCNVTAPLKEAVLPLLDEAGEEVRQIGAANCIYRKGAGLAGANSDVDGIAEALSAASLQDRKAVVIGGGGAARGAIRHLLDRDVQQIILLIRNPAKANPLACMGPISILPLDSCEEAMDGAAAVINASPLGMAEAAPMPSELLSALSRAAGSTAFDMVYAPLETEFIRAARASGCIPVDGLTMLIGQARKAFELFFGLAPPRRKDAELRRLLAGEAVSV